MGRKTQSQPRCGTVCVWIALWCDDFFSFTSWSFFLWLFISFNITTVLCFTDAATGGRRAVLLYLKNSGSGWSVALEILCCRHHRCLQMFSTPRKNYSWTDHLLLWERTGSTIMETFNDSIDNQFELLINIVPGGIERVFQQWCSTFDVSFTVLYPIVRDCWKS